MRNGRAVLLSLLITTACRTSFDIAPGAAPLLAQGQLITTEGEQHPVPDEIRGTVHGPGGSWRLGTYRFPGASCHVAQLYEEHSISEMKDSGVDFEHIRFSGAQGVGAAGYELEIADEQRGCVLVPMAAVDHVEVVDAAARRGKIAGIVVGSVLGGAAVITAIGLITLGLSDSYQ